MLSDCGVHVPAKQGFDIYMDEPQQGPRGSCPGREGTAFGEVYEADTSTVKSDLHFLLDFSTGKLTYLRLTEPCSHGCPQCSVTSN